VSIVLVLVILECRCMFRKRHENHVETVSVNNDSVFEPDVDRSAAGVRYCNTSLDERVSSGRHVR